MKQETASRRPKLPALNLDLDPVGVGEVNPVALRRGFSPAAFSFSSA